MSNELDAEVQNSKMTADSEKPKINLLNLIMIPIFFFFFLLLSIGAFFAFTGGEYQLIRIVRSSINNTTITYYKDDNTNLCYATLGMIAKQGRFLDAWTESFTNVPCTAEVLNMIEKGK